MDQDRGGMRNTHWPVSYTSIVCILSSSALHAILNLRRENPAMCTFILLNERYSDTIFKGSAKMYTLYLQLYSHIATLIFANIHICRGNQVLCACKLPLSHAVEVTVNRCLLFFAQIHTRCLHEQMQISEQC